MPTSWTRSTWCRSPTAAQLTRASLQQDSPTIKNIRLWDPRPLIATYRQLQEIRFYYDFRDVEVDRYQIQSDYREVMLSARELNPDLLPENAHTWINQHLKFTHGSGIVMSPVNAKDTEGLPVFYPQGHSGGLQGWPQDRSARHLLWRGAGQLRGGQDQHPGIRLSARVRQRIRLLPVRRRDQDQRNRAAACCSAITSRTSICWSATRSSRRARF